MQMFETSVCKKATRSLSGKDLLNRQIGLLSAVYSVQLLKCCWQP